MTLAEDISVGFFCVFYFLFVFMWTIFKVFVEFVTILLLLLLLLLFFFFMVCFSDCEAPGNLSSQTRE